MRTPMSSLCLAMRAAAWSLLRGEGNLLYPLYPKIWDNLTPLFAIDLERRLLGDKNRFTPRFQLAWRIAKEVEVDDLYAFNYKEAPWACKTAEQEGDTLWQKTN